MTYRLRAAERGIELTSVRVTVEAESERPRDARRRRRAPPGFTAVRYHVEIESPAPSREVERVVELGDRLSPVLDMLTRRTPIERTVSIERPSRTGGS